MTESDTPHRKHDDLIDAGMRAAFSPGARQRKKKQTEESIIKILGETTGCVTRVSLADTEEEHSPVVRTRTRGGDGSEFPERIGRFHVAGEIARGGVGVVLKARDVDLGRDVALKVLRKEHHGNTDMMQRFLEEAQIEGQLQHPGIVAIHEMGLFADERPYFAMKLVKGRTLSSLLDERRDPAEERQRFLGIFGQICQPLAYAHARGVIHRDLKPSNVMVGAFGEVQAFSDSLISLAGDDGLHEFLISDGRWCCGSMFEGQG